MPWWLTQHLVTLLVASTIVHVAVRIVRAGPVARHALWTIVLIKLVAPPVLAWPWPVPTLAPGRVATVSGEVRPTSDPVVRAWPADRNRTPILAALASERTEPETGILSWNWRPVMMTGWVLGACVFGLIHAISVWRMRQVLRRASRPPGELEAALATIAAQLGMRPVAVRLAPVTTPFIVGLLRPVLVWPETLPAGVADAVVPSLLAHELAHVKRGDCWIGWIELLASCLWWWNPIFWHVRAQVRTNAELACDAWVGHLTPGARRAYAEALLAVSTSPSSPPAPMPAIGMRSTSRRLMERRVALIMRTHVPVRLSQAALCTAAFMAALVLPAWAQQPVPVSPPAPPAPAVSPAPARRVVIQPAPAAGQTVYIRRPAQAPAGGTFFGELPAQGQPGDVFYYATNEKLPESAQALVDRFDQSAGQTRREAEDKIARERTALIAQLQQIQDTETKAGHLDEAVAIRSRIRQLQNPPAVRTVGYRLSTGRSGGAPAADTFFEVFAPASPEPPLPPNSQPPAPPAPR